MKSPPALPQQVADLGIDSRAMESVLFRAVRTGGVQRLNAQQRPRMRFPVDS